MKDFKNEHNSALNKLKLEHTEKVKRIIAEYNGNANVDAKLLNETDEIVRAQRTHIWKQEICTGEDEVKKRHAKELEELRTLHTKRYEKLLRKCEKHQDEFNDLQHRYNSYLTDSMREKLVLKAEKEKICQ